MMRLERRALGPDEFDTEAVFALVIAAYALLTGSLLWLRGTLWACLLHQWTGLPCPACGGTRAVSALLKGEFMTALGYNPLVIVVLAFLLVFMLYVAVVRVFRLRRVRVVMSPAERCWAARAVLAVVFVNWFYLVSAGI